jgi:hypothetical protein
MGAGTHSEMERGWSGDGDGGLGDGGNLMWMGTKYFTVSSSIVTAAVPTSDWFVNDRLSHTQFRVHSNPLPRINGNATQLCLIDNLSSL